MDPLHYVNILEDIEKISTGTNVVRSFLEDFPDDYIATLCSWMQLGEKRCDMCMLMVYMLKYENKGYLLKSHVVADQSILHLAATFHDCQRLVTTLLEMEPELAEQMRIGPHMGLTPLHIIVSKGNSETTRAYLKSLENKDSIMHQATGSRFHGTVLMGETALSAAVLKFVPEEISPDSTDTLQLAKILLAEGACFHDQNSRGDTVIHTLIRYAHLYPERREQVLDTMAEIQSYLLKPDASDRKTRGRLYARHLWFCQNYDQMTALQLAATLGEHEIVCFIMELQWIYRTLHDYDGIFETNKYDITEIDTLAKIEWCKNQQKNSSQLFNERDSLWTKLKRFVSCYDSVVARQSTPAILEVICEVEVGAACNIISTPVVNKLISAKWRKYKLWFYGWAILYILSLIFLSVCASLKFRYVESLKTFETNNQTNEHQYKFSGNVSENPVAAIKFAPHSLDDPSEVHKILINIGCFFALAISILSFYLEFVRSFVQRKPWNLLLVHHNGTYRLLLLMNALALGVDSVWFLLSPATNAKTPMILALLFGWWFSTFFLRPFKKFSFFTVMLMKVLLGDMLRFFTIIIIALASFTMAMHLLFIHGESLPKEFESLPLGCLTMFKLMLGLTDLEILEHADPVWLAVTLFVIYVLLTYVLLINSLIAMMSNTCSEIAGQKSNQWKIQRLSVILFIENMMLCGLVRTSGRKNYFRKNDEGDEVEARYVIEDTKLSVLDKGADLGHDLMAQKMYVASRGPILRHVSSLDLWSLSDQFSQTSKKNGRAASLGNVSFAESFVANVGKKYRQASRRSKSSWSEDNCDSLESETSFQSLKKKKGLSKIFRRRSVTKRKKKKISEYNEFTLPADSQLSVLNDSKVGLNEFDDQSPLKSSLSEPKDFTVSMHQGPQKSSSESLSPRNAEIDQVVTKSDSLRQSQRQRIRHESLNSQHLDSGESREIEKKMNDTNNSQLKTIRTFRRQSSDAPENNIHDNPAELKDDTYNDHPVSDARKHPHGSLADLRRDTVHLLQDTTTLTGEKDTIELDTLLESILPQPEPELNTFIEQDIPRGKLMQSHGLETRETILTDRRISQDSAHVFEYIDEVRDGKETLLFDGDSTRLKSETPSSPRSNVNSESLNNNEIVKAMPETSSDMGDTNVEESKDGKMSAGVSGEPNLTENADGAVSPERDPHWAALLQSIRNLDRDKYNRTTDRKRRPSKSLSDIKQRRNAFIKGLGSSHDYSTVMESEEFM